MKQHQVAQFCEPMGGCLERARGQERRRFWGQERRRFWGQVFGVGIANIRKQTGLSVEDAAELAGMEAAEWAAIEAGSVPRSTARLKDMARAMDVSLGELANLVLLSSEAWTL